MAPVTTTQVLTITLPTVVFILTVLWYRKKKNEKSFGSSEFLEHTCSRSQQAESDPNSSQSVETCSISATQDHADIEKDSLLLSESPTMGRRSKKLKSKKKLEVSADASLSQKTAEFCNQRDKVDSFVVTSPVDVLTDTPSYQKDESYSVEELSCQMNALCVENIQCNAQTVNIDSTLQAETDIVRDTLLQPSNDVSVVDKLPESTELLQSPNDVEVHETNFGNKNKHQNICDSANHSPVEIMLASPSVSNISDAVSEDSTDSGKGGSDTQTLPSLPDTTLLMTPPYTPPNPSEQLMVYEFELPQNLCGRLIGRFGLFVNLIKARTRANILVKGFSTNSRMKLVSVEGLRDDVDAALHMIREKFPRDRFPDVTLEQVNAPQPTLFQTPAGLQVDIPELICLVPDVGSNCISSTGQLNLIEGILNDVIVSSLVSTGHLFVQQHTHPTFPALAKLDECMSICYNEQETPELPRPLEQGVVCAAPVLNGWFRAEVVGTYDDVDECDVRFVDYGGYSKVPCSQLRQIRYDFMTLPFQASECYLAYVVPENAEDGWSLESSAVMEELTRGQVLQVQIAGYAEDGIPYIYMYQISGDTTIFINRELVNRGVARWAESVEQ